MGSSSKKHKSEKRKKRSRSRSTEKERHRHHKRHKSHKHRVEEIISSAESDVEEIVPESPSKLSTPPPPSISSESVTEGKSHDSLSIEQTNALRARLGLKPLQVESTPANDTREPNKEIGDGVDMGEFVHKPPENIAEKQRSEKIRQKLAERKEKRAVEDRLKSVKGLGEADDEEDNAKDWVKKSREKAQQRAAAEKRAKMLEELDEEFGIGALVDEERKTVKKDLYSSRDLKGLKVGHSMTGFTEGSNVILTLKDQDVLNEDDDTLVNVNFLDDERYKKNIERRKAKPKLYDDEMEVDILDEKKSNVLSKYDEEIDGEKAESFAIGEDISEAERIRQRLAVKKKLLKRNVVDLNSELRLASDYFTEEEASAKFRKPGKVKKLRKKPKPLKAEDLAPKQEMSWPPEDLGTRRKPRSYKTEPVDMDIVKEEPDDILDVDDLPPPPEIYNVKIEPDDAELELQLALNKARKLKQKEVHESSIEKIAKEIKESGSGYNLEGPGGSIVLNSTAEFCRTLGDIPTYGLSGNREEEEELLDFEREMRKETKLREEDQKNRGAWSQVEGDEQVSEIVHNDVAILDEEPDVGKGLAGALRLAVSKGYLEKESDNRPSASRFSHLQAQNYSIEDKSHGDDDKFGRRDRYLGPTSDFKEKDNYKPNVKLDYIDDDGHLLNAKEAFRYLSHKFHGKGPGKNKVEKRMKKNEQEGLMKQMSSTDTPLRTLTMLQQKQKETQSAFVVLSGKGQSIGGAVPPKIPFPKGDRSH